MKKVIYVICSKSPNPHLYGCIKKLYDNQLNPEENNKVCVVDSESDDFLFYETVKKSFPDVEINFVKNKNYEYGAWKFALETYPDFDVYFCIQDTVFVNKRIDLSVVNDYTALSWHVPSGFIWHAETREPGIKFLKDSGFYDKYIGTGIEEEQILNSFFSLAAHCSFIVSKNMLVEIFRELTIPPVDKIGSCAYERIFGLFFILKKMVTINIEDSLSKVNGLRI
jgi:hypothetical protein